MGRLILWWLVRDSVVRLVDRIGTLCARSNGSVAGFWRCSAKFGVARPRFVVPTQRSVTLGIDSSGGWGFHM